MENTAAWVLLADVLINGSRSVASVLEKGDFFIEALQAMRRALELDPQYLPAHLLLGRFMIMRSYRNGDDPSEGIGHLQRVIEGIAAPPRGQDRALLAQAHFYTGMGYRTSGDETQALACFRTALEALPGFQPAILAQQGV